MIAQGRLHLFDAGIMAAQVLSDLLVLLGAVGLPALHLDDELIDRFLQGYDTHIELVKEKSATAWQGTEAVRFVTGSGSTTGGLMFAALSVLTV